ncbi:MAG: hypothetical protein Q9218_003076 [Villophora microphyllina]
MSPNPAANVRATSPTEDGDNTPTVSGEWGPRAKRAGKGAGFPNPGSRCYLNSVITVLLHNPKFTNFIESHTSSPSAEHIVVAKESCLVCALAELSSVYRKKTPNLQEITKTLDVFLNLINADGLSDHPWTKAMQNQQHDAREFYVWLLGVLRYQVQGSSSSTGKSLLEGLFGISTQVFLTCLECDSETPKHKPDEYSLNIPCDKDTIDEALDGYFASQDQPGVQCDSWKCNAAKCKKRYAEKLTKGPDVLCIQFNRFEWGLKRRKEMEMQKNQRPVSYGEYLDLTRFVKKGTSLRYRLVGAIHHKGLLDSGHYITVARTPQGRWLRVNDRHVRMVDIKDALKPTDELTPYLLFWQKEPLTAPTSTENGLQKESSPPPSPPKIKKRSHEEANDADASNADRQRSKSPKLTTPTNADPPVTEQSMGHPSTWGWPVNRLVSQLVSNDLHQQRLDEAKRAQAHCEERHRAKDGEIKTLNQQVTKQQILIRRAALTHVHLMETINNLSTGLLASRKAVKAVSSFMHRPDNQKRYPEKVLPFLENEKILEESVAKNKRLTDKSSKRYESLVGSTVGAIEALRKSAKAAMENGTIETWFKTELEELSSPEVEEE